MNIDEILAFAKQCQIPINLHLHFGTLQGAEVWKDMASEPKALKPLGNQILDVLASADGEVKKQTLIEAVFGADFTNAEGRKVTRELDILRRAGRIKDVRHGFWILHS
jgi:hypothetical protein